MVELMILSFGGHQSPYYAGMLIVFIFALGFLPTSFKVTILLASFIYAIYLLPILVFDNITNIRIFINNNVFLIAAAIAGLAWRYYNGTILLKKLSLEYDLAKEKERLKIYSTQLEDMVAERTKELSISEQKFRGLFDNSNDGVAVLDKNGIIINVNHKFCELHGFEKDRLIGTKYFLLEVEDERGEKEERVRKILSGEPAIFETEHYRSDGNNIFLEVSSKSIEIGGELYLQSIHRDITERKMIQEQLMQSQKMESVGMLAGGIAHDFNNMLTGILGNAELLHEYSNLDVLAKQKVKTIESAARKAGQMISRILRFSRKGKSEFLPISLNDVIYDTIELAGKMIENRNIKVKIELDEGVTVVYGDSNQLEQVVMNLLVNAADAMTAGGTITIATSLVEIKEGDNRGKHGLPSGKYALLKVSDTGRGIPDEIKGKIFDPFFTTKGIGKGTGLGLSLVYGIVKEHKGTINVESKLNKGSTFEIYLPHSESFVIRTEKIQSQTLTGKESIMIIDDETDILGFLKETFEKNGYSVMVTDNPISALNIFKRIHENIDLVITDIIMPLVNGRDLIKHFKMIKPEIKVIAISGYDTEKMGKRDRDIDAFINKPFEGFYLLSVIRRILDSKVAKFK
jgi:PAS domain S-box-containing protein